MLTKITNQHDLCIFSCTYTLIDICVTVFVSFVRSTELILSIYSLSIHPFEVTTTLQIIDESRI